MLGANLELDGLEACADADAAWLKCEQAVICFLAHGATRNGCDSRYALVQVEKISIASGATEFESQPHPPN